MLQFATDDSSRHPVGKQVELALQAGCRWIRVTGTPADEIVEGLILLVRIMMPYWCLTTTSNW